MTTALETLTGPPTSGGRVLGRVAADVPGPMLVVVGAVHGNEPAGALALKRVVEHIERTSTLTRGDFVALVGNLSAIAAGERYIDVDLNRQWSRERVQRLVATDDVSSAEDREQRDLLDELHAAFGQARGPIVLLDLHTTSGDGAPFTVFADTIKSRNFARRFPVPAVLGLEEELVGTLVDYVGLEGHTAVGFEGGRHDDPNSVDTLASILWLALDELGVLAPDASALVDESRRSLTETMRGLPTVMEVIYRHAIEPEDRFRMRPGFRSFQPIELGDVLAEDVRGNVRAPKGGFLLMPLYQKQGNDGFFIARPFWPLWLTVSRLLRKARAGRYAHWLPGVTRVQGDDHALAVNQRVARWYSLEILHLLGFRKRAVDGDVLIVERRGRDLP